MFCRKAKPVGKETPPRHSKSMKRALVCMRLRRQTHDDDDKKTHISRDVRQLDPFVPSRPSRSMRLRSRRHKTIQCLNVKTDIQLNWSCNDSLMHSRKSWGGRDKKRQSTTDSKVLLKENDTARTCRPLGLTW